MPLVDLVRYRPFSSAGLISINIAIKAVLTLQNVDGIRLLDSESFECLLHMGCQWRISNSKCG